MLLLLLLTACDDAPPPPPADLTPDQRLSRIRALQDGHTDSAEEAAIRDLLLGARGDELLSLKQSLDRGSSSNLQHLVFHDIDDDSLRTEIIAYLQVAASRQRHLQVLSDIDDTLFANWVDARFPEGAIYPGVLDLYAALSPDSPPTFISARPGDRAGVVEEATLTLLGELGVEGATLLAGDLTHLTSNDDIAEKKHRNFVEYSILYPEYDFVFLGDSGQGDVELGRRMLASHPERVAAVFIHDVVAKDGQATPPQVRAEAAAAGIHYVDTWLDAARIARQQGLIDDEALAAVAVRGGDALAAVTFADAATRAARLAEQQAAWSAAASVLAPALPEQPEALGPELLERCQRDQVLAMAGDAQDIAIAGMLNAAFIREVLAVRGGFPVDDGLTAGAAQCAWRLVQGADDRGIQRAALATLSGAIPEGIAPDEVAALFDEVRIRDGLPQRFGTRLHLLGGVYRPLPIEEPDGLEARRAALGLPPLSESAARLAGDIPVDLEPLSEIPAELREP